MKNRRRLLLIASLPLAVAVALGALAVLSPRPEVMKANFERIEIGMTEAQTRAFTGTDEGFVPYGGFFSPTADVPGPREKYTIKNWYSSNAIIEIWFDENNRVAFKRFWIGGEDFQQRAIRCVKSLMKN